MDNEDSWKIPDQIKNILRPDEKVIVSVGQSRWKEVITPNTIIVTNYRVILYSPSKLGLQKDIEDYQYRDMANFKIEKGVMFSKIKIKMRYMSDDLILDGLRRDKIDIISRVINEGIRRTDSSDIQAQKVNQRTILSESEDPIKLLKIRLARGEITKDEYEDMKRLLE
jgi:hypothetical protein